MITQHDRIGFTVLLVLVAFLAIAIKSYISRKRKKLEQMQARRGTFGSQQDDIWNISGRVNQGHSLPSNHWPTHDHHIPVESFVISDRLAKNVPPPPPYSEVDLPSYEEAVGSSTKIDMAPVHSTPQTSTSTR